MYIFLTQCASKRDHLRNMKITNFQNLFRGTWGCWENLFRPKNFGPGRTGRPVRPILSAIFGYFSNFERQKNPIKCSVLTTFSHLGGQLGSRESTKAKSADVYRRSRSKVTFRGPIFEIFQVSTLVNQTSKNGPQMSKFLSRDAWGSWWVHPLPKIFGPTHCGRPTRPSFVPFWAKLTILHSKKHHKLVRYECHTMV